MARIKKNDQVIVIAGKDKGKTGRVLKVIPETNRVIVEGVGRVTKHTKVGQSANGSRTSWRNARGWCAYGRWGARPPQDGSQRGCAAWSRGQRA